MPDIYQVPLVFNSQGVDNYILQEHFGLDAAPPELSGWEAITRRAGEPGRTVRIALVGKYVQLEDAYLSVAEALKHSAIHHGCKVEIDWVDSETVGDPKVAARLESADGILIPGGFGGRGWEGKIRAARTARERKIPYLGICLGMHVAVSEFARHVAGMEGANSTEMDLETPFPVIDLLPEQKEIADMGGTMRLGADPVKLHDGTRIRRLYDEPVVYERHRHRYEVNNHLPQAARDGRADVLGHVPRRAPRGGDRAVRGRSPVLRRVAVPPRVQVAARAPGAAVQGVRRRRSDSRCGHGHRGPGRQPAQRGRRLSRRRPVRQATEAGTP